MDELEQITRSLTNKCIHFNGLMNDCCKAGVNYDTVRVEKPFGLPCMKTGGTCGKIEFMSIEQAQVQAKELLGAELKVVEAYIKVKAHYLKTNEESGSLRCDCGGLLQYIVARGNKHIWCRCKSCGISFNE